MSMKHLFVFFPIFLAALFTVTPVLGGKVPRNITNNHFLLDLPYGDKGTLYLTQDHSMMLLPSYTNKNYTHVCLGWWDFNEEKQIFKIQRAKKCTFMNGTYRVTRNRDTIQLRNPQRDLVLEMF